MRAYGALLLLSFNLLPGNAQTVDFLKEVQPVLTARCLSCHSGDQPQAGLKAHTREDLMRGGTTGPAIVPGQGKSSLLIAKMEGRQGLRMPPSGPPLDTRIISSISRWIDQGAVFTAANDLGGRVASLAPRLPDLPPGPATNPIDRFVDDYLIRNKLKLRKIVSDGRFARRAWFDLTGVPPTPEELLAFEQSRAVDKRQQAVEALLQNRKAYAGHWITFWNDLLRNDEGVIYHGERKSITEWLLAALEQNLPYDAMVRSLLDPQSKAGSDGFLTGVTWRGVVSASQTPPMQAAQNAAQIFLGMNLKCAGCHDSFINRWKLQDTYGLASMFAAEPLELVRCDVPLGKTSKAQFPFASLGVTFEDSLESRRTAAAGWFAHKENGRFARTIVNRYWKQLLGRGIVEPVDDMDAEPWNQDLLDWLAFDFAQNGYDLQRLLRLIVSSRAYQSEAAEAQTPFVFQGPSLRRLSAEQVQDTISFVTGDWRVNSKRTEAYSTYTREWQLKSDSLSRALGRPIRDQVYTERNTDATTLQALELTNGPLLARRLERGALSLLGKLPPPPSNLFDSKVVRSGALPIEIDLTGARQLWLLIEDVDSYDPGRVSVGWANAELIGPNGAVKLESLHPVRIQSLMKLPASVAPALLGKLGSPLHWEIEGRGFTKFRAQAVIDERARSSDIGPAVRFFVFTEKPELDRLIRIRGQAPYQPPNRNWSSAKLADRLYLHLFARMPSAAERATAAEVLGGVRPSATGLEDLLWALLMSPEFQYLH